MNNNGYLGRDAFLGAGRNGRREPEEVVVPGMGTVLVRCLTAGERDQFEIDTAEARKAKKPTRFRARLVQLSTVDPEGRALFTRADLAALDGLDSAILEPIVDKATELSKLSADAVEEAAKNSPIGPSADSS